MKKENNEITSFVESVINNTDSRREIVKRSHLYFFCTYFSRYINYEMAPFHHEMFRITQDDSIKFAVISAFRGSGKSTIMTMSYILWSILGVPQKKFILIVSQTQEQAKQHFANLKRELETNMLLKKDLGPFETDLTWNTGAIIIPKYNAKIMAVSTEQSIRGLRFGEHRPDLLILDDIEDSLSVKSKESREKTFNWFCSEITPIGSGNTKIIIIGNVLHKDALIKRLENNIDSGEKSGIYREYPIIDENKNILWRAKYPDMKEIEEEKRRVGNKFTWLKEYELKIVDDHEPVIEKEWLRYYQELPTVLRNQGSAYASGVDLAVSEKEKADNTAIVSCKIIGSGDKMKIYIIPNPINTKMRLPVTLDNICTLAKSFGEGIKHRFYIEEVGTQRGLTQLLEDKNIDAIGVNIGQNDKTTRLSIISEYIRSGKILFPEIGSKELIEQILDFGVDGNDDLVDALTTLIIGIMQQPPSTFNMSSEEMQKFRRDLSRAIFGRCSSGGDDWADREDRQMGCGPGRTSSVEITDRGPVRRY